MMNISNHDNVTHKLSDNLSRLLVELAKDFERRALRKCHARGHTNIRQSHYSLFSNLGFGTARLTELAERASITQQAMGKLVKEMEQVGYVKRHTDTSDKRAKIIELTELGELLVNDSLQIVDEVITEYALSLGEEGVAELERVLRLSINKLGLRVFSNKKDPVQYLN
ncbi:MarR family transcriptional regulator [bacterium AH-315-K03]|nr:MarR family transcriptional regulator [bacterium AH-315-K03]MBN4055357.1 MarR family transcriptional regulator [bacterium AH-315-K03]